MKKYITKNWQETFNLGLEIAKNSKPGDCLALFGELGSGKTTFTKGIAKGLNIDDDITSPTFNLVEIYDGSLKLYHFDLYRIEYDDEFDELSFEDYWEGTGLSIIEWAERANDRLPLNTTKIYFEYLENGKRGIKIEHTNN